MASLWESFFLKMSSPTDQQTEEVKVDFEEEAPHQDASLSLEQLNKECETIDAEQAEDLNKVKQLAEEVRFGSVPFTPRIRRRSKRRSNCPQILTI